MNEVEVDQTLWGNRLERWISRTMPKLSEWFKNKDCGCTWRQQKLNELHEYLRELWE